MNSISDSHEKNCQIHMNLEDYDWFHHIVGMSHHCSRRHLDKRVEILLFSTRNIVVPWVQGTVLSGDGPCSLW